MQITISDEMLEYLQSVARRPYIRGARYSRSCLDKNCTDQAFEQGRDIGASNAEIVLARSLLNFDTVIPDVDQDFE